MTDRSLRRSDCYSSTPHARVGLLAAACAVGRGGNVVCLFSLLKIVSAVSAVYSR